MIVSCEITSSYILRGHWLAETTAHVDYQIGIAKIASGLTPVVVFYFLILAREYTTSLPAFHMGNFLVDRLPA
jgi:hypothetical protein